MAACNYCSREMKSKVSCTVTEYDDFPDGVTRQRRHYPVDADWPETCHDCGTPQGGQHHPGCDVERCPGCGGQAISCGCTDEEED